MSEQGAALDIDITEYLVDDGDAEVVITAESARDAAQEYMDTGDWRATDDDECTTWWHHVRTLPVAEQRAYEAAYEAYLADDDAVEAPVAPEWTWHRIEMHPDAPECESGWGEDDPDWDDVIPGGPGRIVQSDGHLWASPYSIVGGISESPGVWGHGGGVTQDSVCLRCSLGRTDDTWATDPYDGTQGLDSVTYHPQRYADALWPTADPQEGAL